MKRMSACPMAVLALCLSLAPGIARAQTPPATGEAEPARVAPDSPRAALTTFLELAGDGRWSDAAAYLDVPPGADGTALAEQLKAVLDREAVIDLEQLSPLATGRADDGLLPWTDEVARVHPADGKPEALRMVRREGAPGGARWVFSRATVKRVGGWYDALPDRWLRDILPESLLQPGPQGLFWWQWLALPLLALLAWGVGRLLSWTTTTIVRRVARRTKATWDDSIAVRLSGPLTIAWALGLIYALLPWLLLPRSGEAFVHQVLSAGFLLVFFWALLRTVVVIGDAVRASAWSQARPGSAGLLSLIVKSSKVVVFIIALVAVLSQLGYPVASLLAGLGIGGLALAFAAQKTIENLFGSVAIGVDQPFRPGDFVKVEDLVGTIESIGLRSTRIRTLDRTLVAIPNGKLADMRVETYGARDRIRLACTLGLVRESTADQVRAALAGLEQTLRAQPKLWTEDLFVRLSRIGEASLDVEIMAWFATKDWDEFVAIRQDVLLGFLEAIERAGTALAYPTRTIRQTAKP
jgi:MscS family membrane protein